MATTKNITMKQFNGTDYDTLYPKTKVEQVENLTPSSIGAVAKTGDTMTGNLSAPSILVSDGRVYLEGDNSHSFIWLRDGNNINNGGAIVRYHGFNNITEELKYERWSNGNVAQYNILHTGNAQSLGFPKIATGSYVGTGYSGQSHPMSINVGFAPKFFWICLRLGNNSLGKTAAYTIPGGGTQEENGLFINPFTKYFCADSASGNNYVTVTWGSTMSWYGVVDYNDTEHGQYQFNEAGVTYYWVAIG